MLDFARKARPTKKASKLEESNRTPEQPEQPEQQNEPQTPVKVVILGRPTHPPRKKPVSSIENAMDVAIGEEGDPWDEEDEAA